MGRTIKLKSIGQAFLESFETIRTSLVLLTLSSDILYLNLFFIWHAKIQDTFRTTKKTFIFVILVFTLTHFPSTQQILVCWTVIQNENKVKYLNFY